MTKRRRRVHSTVLCTGAVAALLEICGCTPRVEVALPDKPIEININAKIEHEVRIKIERDVSQVVQANSEIF